MPQAPSAPGPGARPPLCSARSADPATSWPLSLQSWLLQTHTFDCLSDGPCGHCWYLVPLTSKPRPSAICRGRHLCSLKLVAPGSLSATYSALSHPPWPRGHRYCCLHQPPVHRALPVTPVSLVATPRCFIRVTAESVVFLAPMPTPEGLVSAAPSAAPVWSLTRAGVQRTVRTDHQGITAFSLLKTHDSSVAPSAFSVASGALGDLALSPRHRPCISGPPWALYCGYPCASMLGAWSSFCPHTLYCHCPIILHSQGPLLCSSFARTLLLPPGAPQPQPGHLCTRWAGLGGGTDHTPSQAGGHLAPRAGWEPVRRGHTRTSEHGRGAQSLLLQPAGGQESPSSERSCL